MVVVAGAVANADETPPVVCERKSSNKVPRRTFWTQVVHHPWVFWRIYRQSNDTANPIWQCRGPRKERTALRSRCLPSRCAEYFRGPSGHVCETIKALPSYNGPSSRTPLPIEHTTARGVFARKSVDRYKLEIRREEVQGHYPIYWGILTAALSIFHGKFLFVRIPNSIHAFTSWGGRFVAASSSLPSVKIFASTAIRSDTIGPVHRDSPSRHYPSHRGCRIW